MTSSGKNRVGYKRVLLKLSGEVFGGEKGIGVDPDVVHDIAGQIAEVVRGGTQIAIVVGGGNYFRGAELQQRGMDRARADYMGMLGTVMNCLALQDFLEKEGIETRVQTAITMGQVAERHCQDHGWRERGEDSPDLRRRSSSGAGLRRPQRAARCPVAWKTKFRVKRCNYAGIFPRQDRCPSCYDRH